VKGCVWGGVGGGGYKEEGRGREQRRGGGGREQGRGGGKRAGVGKQGWWLLLHLTVEGGRACVQGCVCRVGGGLLLVLVVVVVAL
jgi:hypothetical protein